MLAVTSIFNKKVFFIIICFLAGGAFLPAQESLELQNNEVINNEVIEDEVNEPVPWYGGLFIEGSGLLYFTPSLIKDYVKPGFGFRVALGYEYNRFRLAVESGYSHLTGTDSLVSQFDFAPLVLKFGYAMPLYSIFGLQADLNAGFAFSKIMRYPTAIDLAMDKVQEDRENSFIAGGRLYATVAPLDFLRIYAGGGIDVILEKEGPLVLPLVEIGVHLKPFARPRKKPEPEPVIEEPVIEEPVIEVIKVVIDLPHIRFQPDSAELHDSEKLKLEEIADILRDIPGVKVRVEGHTAMAGTEQRRLAFSHRRAQAVASHLISLGAVDADNVTVIGHGAERPIADHDTWEGMAANGMSANRRVEIIILDNLEFEALELEDLESENLGSEVLELEDFESEDLESEVLEWEV
jgi:outer membrane protein OmpA-like peptidoglycan-associated protein